MKLSGSSRKWDAQGGDEMILIFGGFNQNPESGWRVDLVVEDGKINLKTMSLWAKLKHRSRNFRVIKLID